MAQIDISTHTDLTANGWHYHGNAAGWYAEKRCQMQGLLTAVAATSAALLTAVGNVEKHHAGLGTNSPEFSQGGSFKGI